MGRVGQSNLSHFWANFDFERSMHFEKNMLDSCTAFGCTNRRSTTSLKFYCIPSAKRYREQRKKWVMDMRGEK